MTFKRTMCAILAASMLTTGAIAAQGSASAATVENESGAVVAEEESGANPYNLPTNIADGNIFHALNWKLSDIKAECKNIAAAGYVAVQTSPFQPHNNSGSWYWLYQPTGFRAGNELGSEDDMKALCAEADKYGLKVVVDVVANHVAGWNDNRIADNVDSNIKNNSSYFHNMGPCSDWNNRYDVTHKNIGMPDLNSEHSEVANFIKAYISQLKSDGVDGIRWDAAKHIGLPSESCQFWPTVTSLGLYNYGEILDSPGGGDGASLMKEYTKYMSVTDNQYSNNTRNAFLGGSPMGGYGNWTAQGVPSTNVVYWAESHDTFFNGMESQAANAYIINKAYASIASRYGSQGLYMSRPTADTNHDTAKYGVKGDTSAGFSKEVTAVNNFRNAMGDKADWYLSSNGCAVITRKGGGAVIVKGSGNGYVEVENGGGYAKAGTYKDAISGNTFTVTSTTIKGETGSTGIAVIYDAGDAPVYSDNDTHSDTTSSDTTSTDTNVSGVNVYFDNSSYNWSSVYAYVYDESTGTARSMAEWPGVKMTSKNSEGYYVLNVDGYANGQVIFSDGSGSDSNRYPADMEPGLQIGGSSKLFSSGHSWANHTESTTSTDTSTKTSDTDKGTVVTSGVNVYFDNSGFNWSKVYAYVYDDTTGTAKANGEWPGVEMTQKSSAGYLVLNVDSFANGKVIFSDGSGSASNRYPADMEPGLDIGGSSKLFSAPTSWKSYEETSKPDTDTSVKDTDTSTKTTDSDVKTTDTVKVLSGDANQDGKVTLRDASLTLKASVGKATLTGNGKTAADIDESMTITSADAVAIQRYDIGIASKNIGKTVEQKIVA